MREDDRKHKIHMNIEFYNCPQPAQFDTNVLPTEKPTFIGYKPDVAQLQMVAEKYAQYKRLLVIGHGGSVTSSYGMYHALRRGIPQSLAKDAYFLSSVDPDYITDVKTELHPSDTLVLAISKSGSDTTQLEALSQFWGYQIVAITEENTPLYQIAQKKNLDIVIHPPVGGRFTAFTEVGLLPLLFCGIDVAGLLRGAQELYALYEKDNLAWKAASVAFQLEQQGFVDVLGLVYSHYLFPTTSLITQLCHESFGKDDKGQTYSFAEGSEVQHHTVQRLLGGRKNMAAWFVGLHAFQTGVATQYPAEIHSIAIRDHALFDLNKIPLAESQRFELEGTLESAKLSNIPIVHMELNGLEPVELGRFVSFWQLYAVYSSVLRKVDPLNQPAVETGKQISFNKRLAYKGLL